MSYSKFKFFDSKGNDLNLSYNAETFLYEGNMYLPEVSSGLYETESVFILEEVEDSIGNTQYITPISEDVNTTSLKFEFKSKYGDSNDIYLYSGELKDNEYVVKKDTNQTQTMLVAGTSLSTNNGRKVITTNIDSVPLFANFTLNSEIEDFHIRTLDIYEVNGTTYNHHIASIKIYGEVIGEDERLTALLGNIGMSLDDSDYMLFKEANIKDLGVDYIKLNEKRRELLLQASEIKPFIGTYKALINAIKFFGYNNLKIKEYWLNIREGSRGFGKLRALAIPNQDNSDGFFANNDKQTNLPSSNLKKTSRFSLVYRLNDTNGTYDEWDIPKVDEIFDFSPTEILIKLYGLKKKLQKDYLPLNAKIIDITGEADYFSQFNLNVWSNQHAIQDQTAGINVKLKIVPEVDVYIEDLRKVDYRLNGLNHDITQETLSDRNAISDSIESFYENYLDIDNSTFNVLDGIPIGAPVVLKADSLNAAWDDAAFTYIDAEVSGVTWENWWRRNVYEIEYLITGPRGYNKTMRGPIEEFSKLPVSLPYVGVYSIDTSYYDLYNIKSTLRGTKVEVKSKNVELYGIYQKLPKKITWNSNYVLSDIGCSWDYERENKMEVRDMIGSYYLGMDRANYPHDNSNGPNFSTVTRYKDTATDTGFSETTGPYFWKNLKEHSWDKGKNISWNMTRIGSDINPSFKMVLHGFNQGFSLDISRFDIATQATINESYTITNGYPGSIADVLQYSNIVDELNSIDASTYPILSSFNYNAILEDTNNDGTEDECPYILAVAKKAISSYDYVDVSFSDVQGGTISGKVHYIGYNPSYQDAHIIEDHDTVNLLNHLTFSYDNSKIPGVDKYKWTLINNSKNEDDIYYNNQYMTYLFKSIGDYTIKLELTDINGNKNTTTKNILTII